MNKFTSMVSASAVVALLCAPIGFSQAAPDDSAHNKNQKVTADSQGNAKADRMLAAKVRRAIIADKDLSMYAHNIKIIALNGAVTLKGPVKSEEEKQKVESDAASAVSAASINNQITVK